MGNYRDWSGDPHAEAVFRRLEDDLAPILARLMPGLKMVKLGINRSDPLSESQEIKLIVHLLPNNPSLDGAYSKVGKSDSNAMQMIASKPI